jgi:hypothetical protein
MVVEGAVHSSCAYSVLERCRFMVVDMALRPLLRAAHGLLKAVWFVRRPRSFGVHALALTPAGKVILVKLRYSPGWRLPGTRISSLAQLGLRSSRRSTFKAW